VDVVDRPSLDAVALVLYRAGPNGREVLTVRTLRPAAHFRTLRPQLLVEEIVAGVLEAGEVEEAAIRARAAAEAREEAGYVLEASAIQLLGGPFFVAAGILSEQIHLAVADVTGLTPLEPTGDGSPLEEGATRVWRPLSEALAACRRGDIQDAKTEIAFSRLDAM
jgi:ADP-ribose pyrophosphatase